MKTICYFFALFPPFYKKNTLFLMNRNKDFSFIFLPFCYKKITTIFPLFFLKTVIFMPFSFYEKYHHFLYLQKILINNICFFSLFFFLFIKKSPFFASFLWKKLLFFTFFFFFIEKKNHNFFSLFSFFSTFLLKKTVFFVYEYFFFL